MKSAKGFVLLVLALSLFAGCSSSDKPAMAKVTGTVRYNGKPMSLASVTFLPEKSGVRNATGSTDANGVYSMTTFETNDGVILGKYRVGIVAIELAPGPPKAADDITAVPPKMLTPLKYSDPNTSGFTVEVTADKKNVFDFDLKD